MRSHYDKLQALKHQLALNIIWIWDERKKILPQQSVNRREIIGML